MHPNTDFQATRNHWAAILFNRGFGISSTLYFSLYLIKAYILGWMQFWLRIPRNEESVMLCRELSSLLMSFFVKKLCLTYNFDMLGYDVICSNTFLAGQSCILKQAFCQFWKQVLSWLFCLLVFCFLFNERIMLEKNPKLTFHQCFKIFELTGSC